MKKTIDIAQQYENYVLPTYGREQLAFVKGEGSYLYDAEGRRFLDLYPGWGTACLGHSHPHIAKAIAKQAAELIHVPNNYYNPWQSELAEKLSSLGFGGYTFFSNSGAEANEGAIKLAKRFGQQNGRYEIITFHESFHGRTLAAVTATAQEKYHSGFGPLPPGFIYVPFGDIDALKKAITPKTCAVMLELIQGEGGVNIATPDFYKDIQTLCKNRNLLLILDEVQTGMGRTGDYFAFQTFGVDPDIVTLAKALGGGVPIGAMMVKPHIKDMLPPGTHASTYGGNPLVCSASLAVLEVFEQEGILDNVKTQADYLNSKLTELKEKTGLIKEIRGKGLMIGVELTVSALNVKQFCREKSVLINNLSETTIRFLPALNISKADLDIGLDVLEQALLKEGNTQ